MDVTTSTQSDLNLWAEEFIGDYASQRYKVLETIHVSETKFQKLSLVKTAGHGKVLFLDGLVMCSERDEFVYHDMIAHVPMFMHPDPKRVLVIGGGDGGTAREALRHKGVERCVMVEIDGDVVDVCREHFKQTSCSFDDPRLELLIEDGVKFMAETKETFDVIMVDSTDPIGPATPLFGEAFYNNVNRVLADNGVVVAQGETPFYEAEAQRLILQNLSKSFDNLYMYNYNNLCYPGGLWSFVMATKGLCPLGDFDPNRLEASGLTFDYYSADVHRAAFMLPQFQLNNVGDVLTPFKK